jgi:hypothetical protein
MWSILLHENRIEVRFALSARRHRLGRGRVVAVMDTTTPVPHGAPDERRWMWIGRDTTGLEIEVLAVELPDCLLVIHAMPARFRRGRWGRGT